MPFTIDLTPELGEKLRHDAADRGVELSAYVARLLEARPSPPDHFPPPDSGWYRKDLLLTRLQLVTVARDRSVLFARLRDES